MTLSARYIDAALAKLPHAEPRTQDGRDLAAIRRYIENAKVRLALVEQRRKSAQ